MNNSWKRFLSLMLAMVMVLSLGVTGFADEGEAEETPAEIAEDSIASTEEAGGENPAEDPAEDPAEEAFPGDGELEMKEISPDKVHVRKLGLEEEEDLGEIVPMDEEDLDTVVRVSIFLDSPATLAAGYSANGVGTNAEAIGYRDALKAQQDAMTAQIESVIGHELNVHWNLTLATNAIAAELSLAEMVKVKEIPGVRSVQRENQYLPMEDGSISDPNTANTSENMVGATAAWAAGYTGAGSRIAIIDTGIDTSHQSFAEEPFTWSVGQAGATGELMTQAEVRNLANQLHSKSSNYVSAKIPYGYNYVDGNTTITHTGDTEGEHGSHVAGIAAANRYIGSAHNDAAATVGAVGMAPDAQLLVMKVFGASGGAYDSDYMAAMEDAIVLGADVCNLSLGSGVQGWTFDNEYQDILNNLVNGQLNEKMVASISAGNSYDLAFMTNAGSLYIEDVDMHTGGSPGSFVNSLCVAAAQNTTTTGTPMNFNNGQKVYYNESTENEDGAFGNPELTTIAGSYTYVYIDAVGEAADYAAVNSAMSLSGKVVIVNRGEINFSDKGNNAKSYSPKAVIIANNSAGTITMDLSDFTGSFPMVSITLGDAETIKANSTRRTTGSYTYYTGTVVISTTKESFTIPRTEATITDFSSWGVPGSLIMKPEITAPGGDIYSVNGTHKTGSGTSGGSAAYEFMSGTSMAAPHITGLSAVLAEALRENLIADRNSTLAEGYTPRAITQSLMMSTATPMAPGGEYLSILQQGAGLVDVYKATTANSAIMMAPTNSGLTGLTGAASDGKVKVELGDDPDRVGDYSFGFTVYNLSDDDLTFEVNTDVFTQAINGEFMSRGTSMLDASATKWWGSVDGSAIPNDHDVNKDGRTDQDDAQAILDFLSGEIEKDALDLTVADLDEDTDITTQDAYLLLGFVSEQEGSAPDGYVPAHGSRYCAVRIKLPEALKASLDVEYPGGAYIEGFTYVRSVGATKDGAVYTDEHSIPILGFYGSWTDASMFETNSYVETLYGNDQLPYTGTSDTNFMKLQMNGSSVKFTGNPYMVEGNAVTDFPSERLAINSNTNILSITYSLIRAAGTTGFAVSKLDEEGKVSSVLSSSVVGTDVNGIYYSQTSGWQNIRTKLYSVNKNLASYGAQEGDRIRVGFYAIPEYNGMQVNNSYIASGSGKLDLAGFNSLLTDNTLGKGAFVGYDFVVDNTEPAITDASLEGSTLTVSARDNMALAYLAVLSLDGETVYVEEAPGISSADLSFDASEAIANAHGYVAVFAGDYAGNEAAVAVKVNDDAYEEKTVYVQTDTLTAGEEYLIVSGSSVGTSQALGHNGSTVATNVVTLRAGIEETGNRVYIDSADVANTSVWTVSSGYRFVNGNYNLRQSNGSLSINTSTSNVNWSWDGGSNRLSTSYNNRSYYLRYYNSTFSLSTATNSVYLFQKTVIHTQVDPYRVLSVTIMPESLDLYKGNTADLSAKVQPLTAGDRSVTWTSSDSSVATVDESGRVTAVGAGTATITAIANSDIEKKGECAVRVTSVNKALNGIVWDEEGGVYFSSFNANNLPTWTKLKDEDKKFPLHSAFMASSSKLYAGTLDTSDVSTVLYSVNRSSYALTEYAANYVAAFDMAPASYYTTSSYNGSYYVYAFAKYLIFGNVAPEDDGEGGTYSGLPYGLMDSSETAVGGAYIAGVCAKTYDTMYFLDETGKIWETTIGTEQRYNEETGRTYTAIVFSDPNLVVDTGIGTSFLYQSLYYDRTYLYWAHQTDNETELIIIVPSTGQVYHAGNFGDGIWPVAGLYVNGSVAPNDLEDEIMAENPGFEMVAKRDDLMTADVIERLNDELSLFGVDADIPLPETGEDQEPADEGIIEDGGTIAPVEEPIIEPVPAEDGQNSAYTGSLMAFRGYVGAAPSVHTAEPQAADDTIAIDVTEIEASHNGLIAVSFDPALVSLESWTDSKNASNISVHVDDKGVVTIAYANKDAGGDDIAQGDAIVTLNFSIADESALECGEIATLITLERNSKLELDEQSDAILPGNPGHDWGEPTWVWADDFEYADAEFVCKNDPENHKATVAATLTEETEGGVTTYTATAVFQGKTYTDTKTVGEHGEIDTSLKFSSRNIVLQDNLQVNYKVKKSLLDAGNFSDPYVVFKMNGTESTVTGTLDAASTYVFSYRNIAPHKLNDTITATLYATRDGKLVQGVTLDYSICQYCYTKLDDITEQNEFATLLVDLLNYGTQSQIYTGYKTDSLANAQLTEAQISWGTAAEPTYNTVQDVQYEVVENPLVTWKAISLFLEDTVSIRLKLAVEDKTGVVLKVRDDNGNEWSYDDSVLKATGSEYYFFFNGLRADQMRKTVYVTAYKDGVAVSNTVRYSIESYCYSQQSKADEALKLLLSAMMKYGDSAYNYVHRQ